MSLSVAIITFNEEKNLPRTLNAVHDLADEIIVVDSFSTDQTAAIAQKYPKVKFIQNKFQGFGQQKNFAISQCSGKWLLFIDADEVPDSSLLNAIKNTIQETHPKFKVYQVRLNNIILGKVVKHGGWGKVFRERFFMNGVAKYSDDIVHERFITTENEGFINGSLNHYTYKNIHHHIEKTNHYTTLMATKMKDIGKKSSLAKIYFKPKFEFFKTFILRGGFLDGRVGYYIAKTAATYTFLKYMKLYEFQKLS